jgi:ABC-type uncharacterized transport system auxiliary subunit
MTKRSVAIILCLAVVALTVSACNLRPKPVIINTYVISTKATLNKVLVSKPYPYTLILPPILGALPLRTQKILYHSSDITLSPYLYSRWEYAPTHMLMVKMINVVNKSGLFKAATYRATGAHGNLYLETILLDFTHHLSPSGQTSYGVVSAIFLLIDGKTRNILASKTFTVKKPAPTLNAEGAALALNAASDELSLKLLAWLKITLESLPKAP